MGRVMSRTNAVIPHFCAPSPNGGGVAGAGAVTCGIVSGFMINE